MIFKYSFLFICLIYHCYCLHTPGVYISLSSVDYLKIEINWYDLDNASSYEVSLYNADPSYHIPKQLISMITSESRGVLKTNYSIGKFPDTIDDAEGCMFYWITLMKDNLTVATNCFKFNPRWMENNKECLRNMSLSRTLIPGTHDSGSIDLKFSSDLISRFTKAQQLSIWQQLLYGIRFIDIRPGLSVFDDKFHVIHGQFYTEHLIEHVIKDVKKFCESTSKEIIIMEFAGFNQGFRGNEAENNHKRLIKLIYDNLQTYMIPRDYGPNVTFSRLWKENKRIVVTYRNSIYKNYSLLWHYIRSSYKGTTDIEMLKKYSTEALEMRDPRDFLVLAGQLTPEFKEVIEGIFDEHTGLRYYADEANREITHFLRGEIGKKANIVANDYPLGSDLVNLAIQRNCQKSNHV